MYELAVTFNRGRNCATTFTFLDILKQFWYILKDDTFATTYTKFIYDNCFVMVLYCHPFGNFNRKNSYSGNAKLLKDWVHKECWVLWHVFYIYRCRLTFECIKNLLLGYTWLLARNFSDGFLCLKAWMTRISFFLRRQKKVNAQFSIHYIHLYIVMTLYLFSTLHVCFIIVVFVWPLQ